MKAQEARADYTVGTTGQRDWPVMTIEEIADVNPRVDKAAIPDDLPVSFVPMPAVGAADGSIRVEETRPAGEVKKGFTAFLEGDVLFAKITPCMENGKMAIVPKLVNGYGFGSTEFHVLRPKPGMDAKYIYYYVASQAFRGEAERYMTGAVGQKRVSTTYLKQSTIPVAPLDQQKRIVAEIEKQFSRLDEAVANLKRVKANLKRYKAAVLKAAASGRLVETEAERARREGRRFETGAQLLQRILETRRSQWQGKGKYKEPAAPDTTDLPELPEGWVWCSGAQFFEWSSGEGLTEKNQRTGPYPVYGGNGISGHHDKYFVANPTIVVGRVGAHCGNVYVTKPECWITDNAIYAKSFPNDAPLEYLQIVFTQAGLNRSAAGSGQPFVNQQMLNEVSIPLPPLDEQLRIVEEVERRLTLLRATEAQVDANLQRAERLRQSILAQAFSGRLKLSEKSVGGVV
ncbi:restriction endonuclease subunit S [Acidithiobacillus sp.]|uniref:restriction endonuclease subunit S n=1 Tax=Acidithiobacillus sp. TaxID=1872118 RepID=UPI00355DD2D4